AAAAEETGELVTIGIKPSWACPGYGYIEQGSPFSLRQQMDGPPVFDVVRFREKPNADLAETFVRQGNFRWNAGMFIWSIPSILSEFNRQAPALAGFVSQIHESRDLNALLEKHFASLPKISVDYAVMEKAANVLVAD